MTKHLHFKAHGHKHRREITHDEMNEMLEMTADYGTEYCMFEDIYDINMRFDGFVRFIRQDRLRLYLSFKTGKKWEHVFTDTSKDYSQFLPEPQVDPTEASKVLSRMAKYEDYVEPNSARFVKIRDFEFLLREEMPDGTFIRNKDLNLGAYQFKDKRDLKRGEYEYAIEYDVNKSYLNVLLNMCHKMPVKYLRSDDCIGEGEMGFTVTGIPVYTTGEFATWVFECGELPGLTKWAKLMESRINQASAEKDAEEKSKLKKQVNFAIGNLANHNPFLRNCIVNGQNEFIRHYIDDNTLWCNTDSIVSSVKRTDIPVGAAVGQFKIAHEGRFRQCGTGYQWPDAGITSNSGVSKAQIELYEKRTGFKFNLYTDDKSIVNGEYLVYFDKLENRLMPVI